VTQDGSPAHATQVCEPSQIWPAQSLLAWQLPETQVPPWQRWLGPNAVTHSASPAHAEQLLLAKSQILPLQSLLAWQLPETQLPETQM
jgi:hypothetical protein